MKLKEGFILRKVADSNMVIPIGNNIANLNGIIALNETAAFLWNYLITGADASTLVEEIVKEYEVDEETARGDLEDFKKQLVLANMLEESE